VFKAIHNYETDEVRVMGIGGTATLHNYRPIGIKRDSTEEVVRIQNVMEREVDEMQEKEFQR
jgi:hypothetical protein